MGMDDNTTLRPRPRSTLLDLKAPAARLPEAADMPPDIPAIDEMVPLPQPGDPYKAYSRPDNKALLTLTFLCKDSAEEGFAYSDLRRIRFLPAEKPGLGRVLVLLFVEAAVTEVRIEGRGKQLAAMRDYIRYHRIAWLRELPPGMMQQDKDATVISTITLRTVEE
jgi:hypothetical protein